MSHPPLPQGEPPSSMSAPPPPPPPPLPPPPPPPASAGPHVEVLDLSSESLAARRQHQLLLLDLEAKKRAFSVDVPTLQRDVRSGLRNLGEPVRLFGENNADVRDRLRMTLARLEVLREGGVEVDTAAALLATSTKKEEEGARRGDEGESQRETTYTHASPELIAARESIAEFSLGRSRSRLEQERRRRRGMAVRCGGRKRSLPSADGGDEGDEKKDDDDEGLAEVEALDASALTLRSALGGLCLEGSQYGDPRPLSAVCSSRGPPAYAAPAGGPFRNPNWVATGSWSGAVRLWDGTSPALEPLATKNLGHEDRITGVAMSPLLGSGGEDETAILATASIDLTGKVWRARRRDDGPAAGDDDEEMRDADEGGGANGGRASSAKKTEDEEPWKIEELHHLKGHAARLCSTAFHPSGNYVGTTSHDHTFRLWDVPTGTQLLLQDGHDFPTYGLGFHPDGSLCATTDYGGVTHLWDLRTGKSAHHFAEGGHAGRVLCAEFAPHGLHLATAGDDGTVRVWDLRRRRVCASVPAHSRLITQLRWGHDCGHGGGGGKKRLAGQNGEFLVSSSFDGTVRAWSGRDWKLWGECRGHEGKVMGADVLDLTSVEKSNGKDEGESVGVGLVSCGFDKTLKLWG